MPNRVICDSIWDSSTLGALPDYIEDQFPRWLLLADDWGCFNANPERIKGLVYPNRKKETPQKITEIRNILEQSGTLFIWKEKGREWGFFVSWDSHHRFCNKTQVGDDGKQIKHRRKTPEPPNDLLNKYLEDFRTRRNILEHDGTICSIPKPNPNPNPNPIKTLMSGKPDEVSEIILYLNSKSGTKFRTTTGPYRISIKARLKEKYTVDDCKMVIDHQISEWKDTDNQKHLNPETLFRPGKFPKYLENAKRTPPKPPSRRVAL